MKTNAIKRVLQKRHTLWVNSIEDEDVRDLARKSTFVTGGAVASLLMEGTINDLDIYFKDTYSAYVVANYYLKKWYARDASDRNTDISLMVNEPENNELENISNEEAEKRYKGKTYPIKVYVASSGIVEDKKLVNEAKRTKGIESAKSEEDKPKFLPMYISDNAISLTNDVQLILRFVGNHEEIHKNFDFVHCTCWYDPIKKELGMPQEALVSIVTKELIYIGSKFPLCSLFRMRKFINRGFSVNAGQMMKMVFKLHALNLWPSEVMREQLIGVDTFYINSFLSAYDAYIRDNNKAPEGTYLYELVDKVFGMDVVK